MFKIEAEDGNARAGVLKTAHGKVETPFFMPVATKGAVKQISGGDLKRLKADAIISNSFLLSLKPGIEYLRDNGGIHSYINFNKTIFTDSGGFQMLSKSLFKGISDRGVKFKNPFNGKTHFLSPEDVMDIQHSIKSDVAMVLDHVSNWGESHDEFRKSLLRTMRWAEIQKKYHDDNCSSKQLLFGIVQGGLFRDLKEFSIRHVNSLDFDGIAIGGLAFGEPRHEMLSILDHSLKYIDMEKMHYLMGIGEPTDLVESVARGMDCFDSRFPTMNARHGTIMTSKGRLMIKNREYRHDQNPIDDECSCSVCRSYSRAYIHNMLRFNEGVGLRLATYHNLHYIMHLMEEIRTAIKENRFQKFRKEFSRIYDSRKRGRFSY